jgi:hypothetical protein
MVLLFNPRKQVWLEHFTWDDGFTHVIGLTATGRATIAPLRMNDNQRAVNARRNFIKAGWNPLHELEIDPPELDLDPTD